MSRPKMSESERHEIQAVRDYLKALENNKPKRGRKSTTKATADEKQFDLPFVEAMVSVGIFGNVPPTIVKGENMDIPTFQRQGLVLDLDD